MMGHTGFNTAIVTNNVVLNMKVVTQGTSSYASVISGFSFEENIYFRKSIDDIMINNNVVSNLEWVTSRGNTMHYYKLRRLKNERNGG